MIVRITFRCQVCKRVYQNVDASKVHLTKRLGAVCEKCTAPVEPPYKGNTYVHLHHRHEV